MSFYSSHQMLLQSGPRSKNNEVNTAVLKTAGLGTPVNHSGRFGRDVNLPSSGQTTEITPRAHQRLI